MAAIAAMDGEVVARHTLDQISEMLGDFYQNRLPRAPRACAVKFSGRIRAHGVDGPGYDPRLTSHRGPPPLNQP